MNQSSDNRPDPDLLLRRLEKEEDQSWRGRLRIYLGAAPGVGKTYAMLQEGQRRKQRGGDVVVGFVETYNRPLTMEALEGLEVIPRKRVDYRGVVLEEMDVDAVRERHPKVALVDELAHTNAPGSRNDKRWQDVMELLAGGITVISTVNVQHLESLNDVVAGITGVRVRETVPDAVIDAADELELIDVSPEALQARMRHGNIYPRGQADQALQGFFRKGNLAALRELALKRAAVEAERQTAEYMHDHQLSGWETGETVLVLLDDTAASEVALRRAWRLAHAFNGELVAAYRSDIARQPGMTHMLTAAMDLNARLQELPGTESLEQELGHVIAAEAVGHVVLIQRYPGGPFGRRGSADALSRALLRRFPHLDVHLVAASRA